MCRGEAEQAVAALEKAVAIRVELYGVAHEAYASASNNLGTS